MLRLRSGLNHFEEATCMEGMTDAGDHRHVDGLLWPIEVERFG